MNPTTDSPPGHPTAPLWLFSSERSGDSDIYLVTPDGSKPDRLTDDPSEDYNPAWSPDGSTVAFFAGEWPGSTICLVNADGSNIRKIVS